MSRVPKGTEFLSAESVNRIFERMNGLGMKRIELSHALGYKNGSYISRLEKGEMRIQKSQVPKWAIALQTTPEYILCETENPSADVYMNKKDRELNRIISIRKSMTDNEAELWIKIGQDIVNARKK